MQKVPRAETVGITGGVVETVKGGGNTGHKNGRDHRRCVKTAEDGGNTGHRNGRDHRWWSQRRVAEIQKTKAIEPMITGGGPQSPEEIQGTAKV